MVDKLSEEQLNELSFNDIKSKMAGFGKHLKNNVLSQMGSSGRWNWLGQGARNNFASAQGYTDNSNLTTNMYQSYLRWLNADTANHTPTLGNILQFINTTYGDQYSKSLRDFVYTDVLNNKYEPRLNTKDNITPSDNTITSNNSSQNQIPTDAGETVQAQQAMNVASQNALNAKRDAWKQQYNKNMGATPNASNNSIEYQNKVMNYIWKTLQQSSNNPKDNKNIIQLTTELINHAKDYGGGEKNRVKAFLQQLKRNPHVLDNRQLSPFILSRTLESLHRALGFAIYLVEHDINTKQGLYEAVTGYLLKEDDNNVKLSQQQITAIFSKLATIMLKNNVNNQENQEENDYNTLNQNDQNVKIVNDLIEMVSDDNGKEILSKPLDANKLAVNFQKYHTADAVAGKILQAVKNNSKLTITDLLKMANGKQITNKIWSAVVKTALS